MDFDATRYGPDVARILALDQNGNRLLPLQWVPCSSSEARNLLQSFAPATLFPGAARPDAAMAGLWLYFNCFEEAHQLADSCQNSDGYYWHAIVHRKEGDSGNAAYWFRKTGAHAVFGKLAPEAVRITRQFPSAEFRTGRWDPYAFISFCDRARAQPGSDQEKAAMQIQRAEWQILFDHCAGPR